MSRSASGSHGTQVLSRENVIIDAEATMDLVLLVQLNLSPPARQETFFYVSNFIPFD
jgi:hypothetical protein